MYLKGLLSGKTHALLDLQFQSFSLITEQGENMLGKFGLAHQPKVLE